MPVLRSVRSQNVVLFPAMDDPPRSQARSVIQDVVVGSFCRSIRLHFRPMNLRLAASAFALLCLQLGAVTLSAAGPPAVRIESVSPDGPWLPGDNLTISVNVTFTDAPYPARIDFVIREEGETEVKEFRPGVSTADFAIGFDARSGSRMLKYTSYTVPLRSCLFQRSNTTPLCPPKGSACSKLPSARRPR